MTDQYSYNDIQPEEDSAQTIANRLNAQKSTGPSSESGKRKSALNAVKTGLTGHTVLLPNDDVTRYDAHVAEWFADLKPQTPREKSLTQSIADTHWRLDRIVKIEHSWYALGRIRFEAALANEMQDDVDSHQIPDLIDGYTHFFYEKQLRNLGIQEARLRRQRDKDLKELRQLQSEREALQLPATPPMNQEQPGTSQTKNGFVFSNGTEINTMGTNPGETRPSPQRKSWKRNNARKGKARKAA